MRIRPPVSRRSLVVLAWPVTALLCLPTPRAAGQNVPGHIISDRPTRQQQAPQPLPPGTIDHLHGVVINSLTGKPVPRVLVTSYDARLAVLTDSEGRFTFDVRRPLPPGPGQDTNATLLQSRYPPNLQTTTLNLRKPGFLTRPASITLPNDTPSSPEPEIRVKITPGGTLSGHISSDRGDTLPPGLTVQLRHRQISGGRASWQQIAFAQPDSQGDFRFPEIGPGDYTLVTQAWAGPPNQRTPQPLSVTGFLPTFYPDVGAADAATSIHIAPGDSAVANIALHSAPFFHVSIPLTTTDPHFGVGVSLTPESPGLSLSTNRDTHTVEGMLPAGSYQVRISNGNQPRSAATVPLQVANAPLSLPPSLSRSHRTSPSSSTVT